MKKLLLPLILCACQGETVPSDRDDGGPPPPPEYDYKEQEINDELDDPNFISLLPQFTSETIAGEFTPQQDIDCFSYFLNPPLGAENVNFNFVIESTLAPTIRASLYQSIVNELGEVEGFQLLGTFQGVDNQLVVLDIYVPYDPFYNYDLIIKLDPMFNHAQGNYYLLDFWCN